MISNRSRLFFISYPVVRFPIYPKDKIFKVIWFQIYSSAPAPTPLPSCTIHSYKLSWWETQNAMRQVRCATEYSVFPRAAPYYSGMRNTVATPHGHITLWFRRSSWRGRCRELESFGGQEVADLNVRCAAEWKKKRRDSDDDRLRGCGDGRGEQLRRKFL